MVRGPAAVLGLLAAGQAYVLLAPELPVITPEDLSIFVASAVGAAVVTLCVAAVAVVSDMPTLLVPLLVGAVALVVALNVADVGAAATPVEALAYGAGGALLTTGLLSPGMALAMPVFVAVIDVISTLAGGPSALLANAGQTQPGDPLSLEMPDWGIGLPAGRLGISDAVFAGVFLVYARRFGLRPTATAVALWVATVAAIGIKLVTDAAVPVLPLMAIGYFLVNADRLRPLLAQARRG